MKGGWCNFGIKIRRTPTILSTVNLCHSFSLSPSSFLIGSFNLSQNPKFTHTASRDRERGIGAMGSQILQASLLLPNNHSVRPDSFLRRSSGELRFNPFLTQATSFRQNSSSLLTRRRNTAGSRVVLASSTSSNAVANTWLPDKAAKSPSLSDVVWPSLGAFAAMAMLGKIDQVLLAKGISMTIAPLGAVCAVLFLTPSSPAAKKYNMFMAQIGCAAIGVLAFTFLGPGWLARSVGLAASIAYMVYTQCTHPPAASLPLLFIDGAKLHHLNYWYALFPGAAGCIILCLLQEVVCYLKDNFKF